MDTLVPRVSVIVPVYNVEEFLEECLASLAAQTLTDLQVVMVDDGSRDNSAEIARAFAARDDRFQLVQQPNGGLGKARNTGIDHATGEFLFFLDSDDVLPPHALERLAGTAANTGSDFVAGNVARLNRIGVRPSPMHVKAFGTTRLRTHITRDWVLLTDRLVTNKLWRRTFWDEHAMRFPEGVLYEDVAVALPAHFLARQVDVVREVIYHWREREAGSASITQDRTDVQHLIDRAQAVEKVRSFLADRGDEEALRRWEATALRSDLRIFLNLVLDVDEDYQRRVCEVVGDFIDTSHDDVLAALPAILRLKYELARRRKVDELATVLRFERHELTMRAPIRRDGHLYGDYPFFDDTSLGLPASTFLLDDELDLVARVDRIAVDGTTLVVGGYSYIEKVDTLSAEDSSIRLWLQNDRSGRRIDLDVRRESRPEPTAAARAAIHGYDASAWSVELTPGLLRAALARLGPPRSTRWHLVAEVAAAGLTRSGPVIGPVAGPAEVMPAVELSGDVRISTHGGRHGEFDVVVERVSGWITDGTWGQDGLTVTGRVGRGTVPESLAAQRVGVGDTVLAPITRTGRTWTALLPVEAMLGGVDHSGGSADGSSTVDDASTAGRPTPAGATDRVDWALSIVPRQSRLRRGRRKRRAAMPTGAPNRSTLLGGREFALSRTRHGTAVVYEQAPRPYAERVETNDGLVNIHGALPGHVPGQEYELVLLARGALGRVAFPIEIVNGAFSVSFDPMRVEDLNGVTPLPSGRWSIGVQRRDQDDTWRDFRVGPMVFNALPEPIVRDGRSVRFSTQAMNVPVLIVSTGLTDDEQGVYRQHLLATRSYPAARDAGLRDVVLLDCYGGKQYSDSPREIHEELRRRGDDREHLLVVRDQQVVVPDGLTAVRFGSREWYEAYARSRWIIGNQHFPQWYTRAEGQTCVETWHGTPLKKIGFDIDAVRFGHGDYHDRLRKEVPNWTHLVSPNPFSTPILERAFDFQGAMLETGYPRNDMLHKPDPQRVEAVRCRLGLPEGKRVVLYAPTWRDDRMYRPGRYMLDLRLDLDEAQRRLGDDHVLLVRRHPNVVDRVVEAGNGFVFDVSTYPDINELFLVTDVLVTDYSSLMFDFANTGRPMLFFTYDLETYRDQLRGFYFDFEASSPGPLLMTSDDIITALGDVDTACAPFAERYAAFVQLFCPWDDGAAAGRVIDEVFGD